MAVNEGFARFQKRLNHTIIANPVTGPPFDRKGKAEADLEYKQFGKFINKHLYLSELCEQLDVM